MNNNINPDYIFNPALVIQPENNPFAEMSTSIFRKLNTYSFDNASMPDLVHLYYQIQNIRDSISNFKDTSSTFHVYSAYLNNLEESISLFFRDYNAKSITGTWAISQDGIGQAMSASLLALVDVTKCPTVTNLWRFAGLDPKHTKWNPLLKNISWKIGMSFQYSSAFNTFYGDIYINDLNRRKSLNEKNSTLSDSSESVLPQNRLEAQARRYATKIFLSHWHHVRYRELTGQDPVNTFSDSTRYIKPLNFPF